jgi:hypothetical protein
MKYNTKHINTTTSKWDVALYISAWNSTQIRKETQIVLSLIKLTFPIPKNFQTNTLALDDTYINV